MIEYVCKLDKELYNCVTDDIQSDEVIITDERIAHIKAGHPNDYETYSHYLALAVTEPDYIIQDERPATALVLKTIDAGGAKIRLSLRLHTSNDPITYKNSILTFLKIRNSEWERLIKNKNVLYKHE